MQTLHIAIKPLDSNHAELRYWGDRPAHYERQVLPLQTIADLIEQSELDYYVLRPDLSAMGKRLFLWLDGAGRWLSRAINECADEGVVLAITAESTLSHLPWETLHDGNGFLIERDYPLVAPIRWLNQPAPHRPPQPRPLEILFMASSPENVQPVLDFEQEEASILRVTQDLPLTLRVEESGCIQELGKLWMRYPDNTFDVFHLTGHASVQSQPPYNPYFITESLIGERQETTVAELQKVFQVRRPRLIFLSGCRTGQGGNQGSVPSFAEALVRQGMPAVLGWGRPITDAVATRAAVCLYERLAAGDQLVQAVALTHRFLLQEQVKDWHLLRLYVRGEAGGALVEPPGDYVPPPEPIQYQFLDAEQKVRVATPEQFVGRRRTIQRCLRALREARTIGVLLHGLGGVGKSSTAARLLERLPDYQPLVLYRELDAQMLEGALFRQCVSEAGQGILNSHLPLMQRLTAFLSRGLNEPHQKLIFVLDDFEANLEARVDGSQGLKPEVVEVLMALLQAISQSGKPHRVLITSRYDVRLPELDDRLHREPLAALQGADLQKKCERLPSFQRQAAVVPDLQEQARTIADGNPRLLEWLDRILQDEQTDAALILERMQQQATEFRESILVQELLNQQDEALQNLLARGLVFTLPVPVSVMAAIWTSIPSWEHHRDRAIELGLLEWTPLSEEPSCRVPRILTPLLPSVEDESLPNNALEVLYQRWWFETESKTEEQVLELYRLAQLAQSDEIIYVVGKALASHWKEQGRYRESGALWEPILKMRRSLLGETHPDVINDLNFLADLYLSLGRYLEVEHLLRPIVEKYHSLSGEAHPGIEASFHNLAALYNYQGRYSEAEPLFLQALEIKQQLLGENHPDLALSLNNLGNLYIHQKRYVEAESFLRQALEARQRILGVDHPAVANTLNNLASLYIYQGDYEKAETFLLQTLDQEQRVLGAEHPAVASSLNNLALVYQAQMRHEQAEPFFLQSLELTKRLLGEEHPNFSASLYSLAETYRAQGRYAEAEPLFLQALDLQLQVFGESHHQVATILHNLALLYDSQEDYERSEPLFLQSLELMKRLLGEEDPEFVRSLHNIASSYKAQDRYSEAQPLFLQVLERGHLLVEKHHLVISSSFSQLAEICESQGHYEQAETLLLQAIKLHQQVSGENHPDFASSLIWLADLYKSQGRYIEAKPLFLHALELQQRLLGENHPDVAQSLNNLALLYTSQGRYAEAEPLFLQSLDLMKRLFGEEHPNFATSLHNLADLYRTQGRYELSEPQLLRALELRQRLLGENHPDVAQSLNNLALLYTSQGRYAEAEPFYIKALELNQRLLGEEHAYVAKGLNNLATLYRYQERYTEAEPLLLQALEMKKRRLGEVHPDVSISLNNLAEFYISQKRYEKVEQLYLQALAITMAALGENHPHTQMFWQNFVVFLQTVVEDGQTEVLSDHPLVQDLLRQMRLELRRGNQPSSRKVTKRHFIGHIPQSFRRLIKRGFRCLSTRSRH